MNWENFVVQLIGYVGLTFSILAFQCKQHKRVMVFKTLNEAFFIVQYLCLASYTGAAMNLVGCVRNLSFAKCVEQEKSTKRLQILFSGIFVVAGLLTPGTWLVKIALVGAKVISTIAYGIKNTRYIRFLILPTSTCWLIYNYSCGSSAGVLCEAFTLLSILTAIVRIDILEARRSKHQPTEAAEAKAEAIAESKV